jgi:5'-nucleotidase
MVNGILIAQAGTGTDQIGRFDLEIDTDQNCVHSYKWTSIPISEETCPKDLALEEVLSYYKVATEKKYSRIVTRLKRRLTHPSRYQETELGNLIADIFRESKNLDLMLLGSGSVRSTEMGPIVLLSDLTECFPYDDMMHRLLVKGSQLKRMIRYMLRDEVWEGSHCEFYQFSQGMRVVYDKASREFKEFSLGGEPVEDERIYKIGMQHFHYLNLEEFFNVPLKEIAENGAPKVVATSCREILDEYLSNHQNLDSQICGRLVVE